MATEAGAKVGDLEPQAQLVECVPEPEVLSIDVSASPEEPSPVQKAHTANIEQVGADPPPWVTHG